MNNLMQTYLINAENKFFILMGSNLVSYVITQACS